MQYKVKVTVVDKKLYPELQRQYCADRDAGACPLYNVGDEFLFERYAGKDDFWSMGRGSQCSEAWDAISRYIYTGLQGGAIMRGWMNDDRVMIVCCSDGTRPVIFKIERIDYQAVYIDVLKDNSCRDKIKTALLGLEHITQVVFRKEEDFAEFAEIYVDSAVDYKKIVACVKALGDYKVQRIE